MCIRDSPNTTQIDGVRIYGIARTGLYVIGTPKVIGSLIEQIPGTIEILASDFNFADLDFHISTINPRVPPAPPSIAYRNN